MASPNEDDDMQKAIKGAREDSKLEFEQSRDRVLGLLPDEYKALLGAIAFCKWKTKWQPCLIRSPYDVPPGDIRNQWMGAFEKLKSGGRVQQMTFLVYWYGAEPSQWYSFMPRKSLVLYEQAATKQIPVDNPPKTLLSAYDEMNEDLEKSPSSRKRGDYIFQEGYELITEDDYLEVVADAVIETPPPKKSKTNSKKRSRNTTETAKTEDTGKEAKKGRKRKTKNKPVEKNEQTGARSLLQHEKDHKLCEMSYKTLVERWSKAVDDEKAEDFTELLEELNAAVNQFSIVFIEKRNLSALVEKTDKLLDGEEHNGARTLFKQFQTKFQRNLQKKMEDGAQRLSPISAKVDPIEDVTMEEVDEEADLKSEKDVDYVESEKDVDDLDNHIDEGESSVAPRAKRKKARATTTTKQEKLAKPNKRGPAKRAPSINKKFMTSWEKILASKRLDDLKAKLEKALLLAGNVSAEFIISNSGTLNTLMRQSKQLLKEVGEDVSKVKKLKEKFLEVVSAAKQQAAPEPTSTDEPKERKLIKKEGDQTKTDEPKKRKTIKREGDQSERMKADESRKRKMIKEEVVPAERTKAEEPIKRKEDAVQSVPTKTDEPIKRKTIKKEVVQRGPVKNAESSIQQEPSPTALKTASQEHRNGGKSQQQDEPTLPHTTNNASNTVCPDVGRSQALLKTPPQIQKKRSFMSLDSILNPTSESGHQPSSQVTKEANDKTVETSAVRPVVSSWLSADCCQHERQTENARSLATEFLEQMLECLLSDSTNPTKFASMAIQIEAATFDLTNPSDKPSWEVYWQKIHKAIALSSSKNQPSSLLDRLVGGEFASPTQFIQILDSEQEKWFAEESTLQPAGAVEN